MNSFINQLKKTIKKLGIFYLLISSVISTILVYGIIYGLLLVHFEKIVFINVEVFNIIIFLLLVFLASFSISVIIVWFAYKSINYENIKVEEKDDER